MKIFYFLIGILIILIMSLDEKDIKERLEALELRVGSVSYPVSFESQKAIESATDNYLKNKAIDLNWNNTVRYTTFFDSLDGWDVSGSGGTGFIIMDSSAGVWFKTDPTTNHFEELWKIPISNMLSFYKKSRFRIQFESVDATAQIIYLGIGSYNGDFYGFKVIDDKLYGVIANSDTSAETTKLLKTITSGTVYLLEASYDPQKGVRFSSIDDSINRVELGFIPYGANMPKKLSGGKVFYPEGLFDFYIKTTENDFHEMYIPFLDFIQEINF
jgi:hypothetical protein